MEFRLLGPLEVLDGRAALTLPAGKARALFAVLLLDANRAVARDQLIDALWADEVPATAQKMVQIYVSQLRKALPEPRLKTSAAGYLLEAGDDEVDVVRFERALQRARRAADGGDAATARDVLEGALALWRGRALAEFAEPFAAHEGPRLEELRLRALEQRLDADLALGHHRDLVGELETLVAQHPLRERLRSQHMLALYRSGRHAEALTSYHGFRRTLARDLGIDPPASLRELERMVLRQDAALDPPVSGPAAIAGHAADRTPGDGAIHAGQGGDVHYARSGHVRIAYEVVGEGPVDLVLVNGWICTFQPGWEHPKLAAFYRRLAGMGRLILFDKRGTGLSDRVSPEQLPDLETRMDDVRAVLDAVGSERAVVLGISEGGAMSTLFAASHPERALGLVLIGTFARMLQAPDYPIGLTDDDYRVRLATTEEDDWATAVTKEWLARVGPDILRDPAALRWYLSYVVRGASPGANRAIRLMNAEIDVRDVLPTIGVPTLVLYRSREYFREGTRFMGERIPGARVVELPGSDHLPWEGDQAALLDEIERFLADLHADVEPRRVLATLLHAEIAGAAGRHRALVRAELRRFHGQEVACSDDGFVATFDGPARAVRCAAAVVAGCRRLGVDVRAGVHTGEIEQADDGVRGSALEIGARIAAAAAPGEVLVSSTVRDLVVGSGIAFDERGERELADVPGTWRLHAARP